MQSRKDKDHGEKSSVFLHVSGPCGPLSPGFVSFSGETERSASSHEINWYRAYFPPVTIPSGPDAGQGVFEKANDFLIQRRPQDAPNHHTANFRRIIAGIK